MARTLSLVGSAAILFLITGCVSSQSYRALQLDDDQKKESLANAQRDLDAANAEAIAYKSQVQQLMASGSTSQGLVTNLSQQNADLQASNDDIHRRYDSLTGSVASLSGPLPTALTAELSAFAKQNPDLIDFDAAHGIVKFKSDVTFAVGDAELNARAREVIDKFAQILDTPGASSYELLVAGHTDNRPVANPATIRKGHKDNWYLSAHRAISVGNELRHAGVAANRLGVVGYADQRPLADNSTAAGRAQNRRVEVLILPTTVRAAPVLASERVEPAPKAEPAPILNKDTAAAPTGPILNK